MPPLLSLPLSLSSPPLLVWSLPWRAGARGDKRPRRCGRARSRDDALLRELRFTPFSPTLARLTVLRTLAFLCTHCTVQSVSIVSTFVARLAGHCTWTDGQRGTSSPPAGRPPCHALPVPGPVSVPVNHFLVALPSSRTPCAVRNATVPAPVEYLCQNERYPDVGHSRVGSPAAGKAVRRWACNPRKSTARLSHPTSRPSQQAAHQASVPRRACPSGALALAPPALAWPACLPACTVRSWAGRPATTASLQLTPAYRRRRRATVCHRTTASYRQPLPSVVHRPSSSVRHPSCQCRASSVERASLQRPQQRPACTVLYSTLRRPDGDDNGRGQQQQHLAANHSGPSW